MVRLKLTLAYRGTSFHGWQIQAHARGPQPRTIQGCLEEAVARILGLPTRVQGASRTDAGVHARGQVAHVDIPEDKLRVNWQAALNATVPRDVTVLAVEPVTPEFHARFSAKAKTYTYSLWLSRRYVLPQRRHFVWPVGPLDVAAMEAAAIHFTGRRDFTSFQNQGTEVESPVRTVYELARCASAGQELFTEPELEVVWRIRGDGFLKQMVRNIVGCLVAVGKGKLAPEDVPGIFAAHDRTQAPATAPAQGLTLLRVHY